MTVESTSYSPDSYSGNGSTTSFTITFDYLDDDHVVVKLIDTTVTPNTVTTLTSGTHYNITGGAVVTTAGNTPATGETLWIGRTTPGTQATDFKNLSTFDAEDVEDALDKTILLLQEKSEETSRSLRFKETSGYSDVEIDGTLSANKYLKVNSDGDGFDLVTSLSTSSVTVTDYAKTLLDDTDAATALATLGLTATAAELNILDGIDAVNDEDTMSSDSDTALATQQSIKAYIASQVGTIETIPAGAVMPFAMDTPPTGWLECDGSAKSRATYSDLFSAIGAVYGVGDGSTTFNLPDLRGQFVRGYDHGAGTDPDAGTRTDSGDGSTTGDNVGTKQAEEVGPHGHTGSGSFGVTSSGSGSSTVVLRSAAVGAADGNQTVSVTVNNSTGDESRPINVALMYCIKY